MPYKKYDPKVDELREGMKIRLAGREGEVSVVGSERAHVLWSETLDTTGWYDILQHHWYPYLEIFVQPLTIPQRTKQVVLEKYLDPKINYETYRAFLESLEVTND